MSKRSYYRCYVTMLRDSLFAELKRYCAHWKDILPARQDNMSHFKGIYGFVKAAIPRTIPFAAPKHLVAPTFAWTVSRSLLSIGVPQGPCFHWDIPYSCRNSCSLSQHVVKMTIHQLDYPSGEVLKMKTLITERLPSCILNCVLLFLKLLWNSKLS